MQKLLSSQALSDGSSADDTNQPAYQQQQQHYQQQQQIQATDNIIQSYQTRDLEWCSDQSPKKGQLQVTNPALPWLWCCSISALQLFSTHWLVSAQLTKCNLECYMVRN